MAILTSLSLSIPFSCHYCCCCLLFFSPGISSIIFIIWACFDRAFLFSILYILIMLLCWYYLFSSVLQYKLPHFSRRSYILEYTNTNNNNNNKNLQQQHCISMCSFFTKHIKIILIISSGWYIIWKYAYTRHIIPYRYAIS